MIPEIIKRWDANKEKLREYFKTTPKAEYTDYHHIVKKIFELCINTSENDYDNYDTDKMTVIDDGHYQGTQIFIIPEKTYQPSVSEYIFTDTYYGSCSGCDTLQSICNYDDGIPSEEQVNEYMTLALHLVQKLRPLVAED